MNKLYTLLIALLLAFSASAQCPIDTTQLPATGPGIYPSAQHLPHIVKDSLWDQVVVGRIQDTMSMNFLGFVNVSIRVDSVRLDSINGLPNGIIWVKSPDVLRGGHSGCVNMAGSTSDTAGTYFLDPVGMIWVHLTAPALGLDKDTFQYGSLSQLPPWRNYYVVVDSAPQPLTVTTTTLNMCYGATGTGRAIANASGGSPVSPYTYSWNTGATTYSLLDVNAGTYTVTVTSGSETATATAIVVQEPSPITTNITTNGGSTGADGYAYLTVSGGVPPYTYFWNMGAGNGDSLTGLGPGTYRVTVRDSFNCIARDTVIIQDLSSGISTVFGGRAQISLFPNPANSVLNLQIETQTVLNAQLQIIDITGRIVYAEPMNVSGTATRQISVEKLYPGNYILQLRSGNQVARQRFVVGK